METEQRRCILWFDSDNYCLNEEFSFMFEVRLWICWHFA